jgi:hypothetical protein
MNGFERPISYVVGPDGNPLTVANLPPNKAVRWPIRRKAEVVAAVRGGLLSLEEACERYSLSVEEFLNWQRSLDRFGQDGLKVTKIKKYRASDLFQPTERAAGY